MYGKGTISELTNRISGLFKEGVVESSRNPMGNQIETVIELDTANLHVLPDTCFLKGHSEPFTLVVFGATGDLTTRKLAPALYNLYLSGAIQKPFTIVGAARREMSHQQFRERIKAAVVGMNMERWEGFAASLYYQPMRFDSLDSFSVLADLLRTLEADSNPQSNRIFYMAIPPSLYKGTIELLGYAGLSHAAPDRKGWTRIVVEKPFGRDLKSAIDLNLSLRRHFSENQIFRIDHYLAKETVQNVLTFRFANAIFEPLWNRMFIDHIRITAAESLGVENRGEYYEQTGVLRDMFQNHMMQLLALAAMEPPARLEADCLRDEKCKVFKSLKPLSAVDASRAVILGQYAVGTVDGVLRPGYREEPGVDRQSLTPTFATIKVFVDNWRWRGVPFYLTSGKRLAKKKTEIVIHFKQVPHSMFDTMLADNVRPNILTLDIHPQERIGLSFQIKHPGPKMCLRTVRMMFDYRQDYKGAKLDAYEKAIIDCLQGDQTLFWRQDGVELSWSFLDPILEACEDCSDARPKLLFYEAGSWGPNAAQLGTDKQA